MTQLCSVCGHGLYFHAKGVTLDPQACVVNGLKCGSHTYASSVNAFFHYLLTKKKFNAEPIAYLPLNGDVLDKGGQSNNGTVTGSTTFATGKVAPTTNGAFDFDGASHIELDNESNFDFERTRAFSGSAWIKVAVDDFGVFASKMPGSPNRGWEFAMDSTGKIRLLLINDFPGGNYITATSTNVVDDGVWHHVAFTYDGSSTAAGILFYIDGVLETTIAVTDNLSLTILNNLAVTIGFRTGGTLFLTGQLDNVAIWDYELSAKAISNLYNKGAGLQILS